MISGIHRDASHTACFQDRSVNQDVMLTDVDVLSADDHCRMAHTRQYARLAASAAVAALYTRNVLCSPVSASDIPCTGVHGRYYWEQPAYPRCLAMWYSFARPCYETALSHGARPAAVATRTASVQDVVGGCEHATCKRIRGAVSASSLTCRGLRQLSRGLHGRPHAMAQHERSRWVAAVCNPSARENLWHSAARSVYTSASAAAVHPVMPLRSSHLVGEHLLESGGTVVDSAFDLSGCQGHVLPSCQDLGSAPWAQAIRERRWHHIEHLLFECPGIMGVGGSLVMTLLRDDLLLGVFWIQSCQVA